MSYVGRKYSDVVRGIELKRPIYNPDKLDGSDQKFFELYQNGLGENNLIYTSVVLGDLINRCEDDDLEIYNALLVEEPEAHLHPQYQNTFFEYLNTLQEKGLQIFVTSHSPTITAKCDLNRIIVLQKQSNETQVFSFSDLEEVDFFGVNRRYLLKFLDTTKSQMFFANAVILVEGIAEVILLPILSKKFFVDKIDLEKHGVEIVNVAGVAFEHFGKLFNNPNKKKRLLAKCSLITDSDPTAAKPVSDRASKADALKGENLHVSLAPNTFEFDLFNQSDNNKNIMRKVYRAMHPNTPDLAGDFVAETLMEKLKSNKDKADFALALYEELLITDTFDVPDYIQSALYFLDLK
jgi:putative ATP-dependent endonuclease of OLD family